MSPSPCYCKAALLPTFTGNGVYRKLLTLNMHDSSESTLGVPFLAGFLILLSLYILWYRQVDPLVSSQPALSFSPDAYRLNFSNPPWTCTTTIPLLGVL